MQTNENQKLGAYATPNNPEKMARTIFEPVLHKQDIVRLLEYIFPLCCQMSVTSS